MRQPYAAQMPLRRGPGFLNQYDSHWLNYGRARLSHHSTLLKIQAMYTAQSHAFRINSSILKSRWKRGPPIGIVRRMHTAYERSPTFAPVESSHSQAVETSSTKVDGSLCSAPMDHSRDNPSTNSTEQSDSITIDVREHVDEQYVPLVSLVPLAYQIPRSVLHLAKQAAPNTRASYYSTTMYRGPKDDTVSIHYCQSPEVARRVAQHFLKEKVIGFDIEWKPRCNPYSVKQNASLIQLACENRIALFHIALFPGRHPRKLMPSSLRAVLESPNIIKVGVNIKGDFTRLEKYLDIHAQGVFELSRLHNLVEWHATDPGKVSHKLVGLAAQVLQHLQLPLYKGTLLEDEPEITSSVRRSDWSKKLDFDQIQYAASDSYAGFRLYHVLEWKRKQMRPVPPPVPLCDYDSKSANKSKTPRKDAKPTDKQNEKMNRKDEEPIKAAQERASESDRDSESGEGYETASEQPLLNHMSGRVVRPSSSDLDKGANQRTNHAALSIVQGLEQLHDVECGEISKRRQIGEVSLSWAPGPDPGYPTLFPRPSEISNETSPQQSNVDDDEFDDPELELALNDLRLDSDGELQEAEEEHALSYVPCASSTAVLPSTSKTRGDIDAQSHCPLPAQASDEFHSSQYADATRWAQSYLQSTVPSPLSKTSTRIRATISHLRTYHMWAHQKLSLDDIAKHLRDPPLEISTVTTYIAQAVCLEKLQCDREALKDVIMAMPLALRQGRWKQLSKQVDASDGDMH